MPASVTVAAGQLSATFTVTTSSVGARTTATISGSWNGAVRSAALTIDPAPSAPAADTVRIGRAEYTVSKRQLRVEASSTNGAATLKAYVTSSGALIGTLRNVGSGRYSGQFSWSVNPQQITVRSSAGGSATATVVAK